MPRQHIRSHGRCIFCDKPLTDEEIGGECTSSVETQGAVGAPPPSTIMSAPTAGDILNYARRLVSGNRAVQHGPKERCHQNIADHWNAYLGFRLTTPLTALDVALMMVELKIARTKTGSGVTFRDNYVDMAGYAGVAGEIALNGKEV